MMMLEEHSTNGNNYISPFPHHSMFFTHQSSPMNTGGPDRLKFQSYRASPYNYSQTQRKSSPNDGKTFFFLHFLLFTFFCIFKLLNIIQLSSKKLTLYH
jgi:hypothetical protein